MKNPVFEQRPDESIKAFEAFRLYREMGSARTTSKVAKQLSKSCQLIRRWAGRYDWSGRSKAYDAHLDQKTREAEEAKLKDQAGVWATRMQKVREQDWQIAQQLREKALAMLKFPLSQTKTDKDGKTVVINPVKWSLADIPRMVEVASKLERLCTNLPTDKNEHSGPDNAPLPAASPASTVVVYLPSNGRDGK